jgi:hypothetical protein
MSSSRTDEAERVMRQIMTALESQQKSGAHLTAERLEPLSSAAVRIAEATQNGFWAHWAADFHGRAGVGVPAVLSAATARWASTR